MIPVAVPSLIFVVLFYLAPPLGLIGTLVWLGCLIATLVEHRRVALRKPRWWLTGLLLLLMDAFTVCLIYAGRQSAQEAETEAAYRESRQAFILPRDFQYGELLIPAGSQIERYDPFDTGKPDRPLKLSGLRNVRFAHPLRVAGVDAVAMEAYPGRLELAHDQTLDGQHCAKGEVALFEVPLIEYDIEKEFGHEEPDGPAARFKPSQWRFRECERNRPIKVQPPNPTPPVFPPANDRSAPTG
ncbi:MAG: hypothetical protein GAK43_01497 [Stenotrophomonas maltophilia]|nr:MAG: hypothetical protein GAK43_01497 [Stenotrophomonas maltophilia]